MGYVGAGYLGAGMVGAGLNVFLRWGELITPTTPGLNPWSWLFTVVGIPTVDFTTLLYATVGGALVGVVSAYLGTFIRKKVGGDPL